MRVSQIIAHVRDLSEDRTVNKWGDAQIAREFHLQRLKVFRKLVETDENYSNILISRTANQAVSIRSDHHEYELPQSAYKIIAVRKGSVSTQSENVMIRKWDKFSRQSGWTMGTGPTLVLRNYGTTEDLDIEVAKTPARLTKGTLPDQTGMAANQLRLDSDSSTDAGTFPHEVQEDSYAGELFELTGVNDVSRQPGGQINRCISSAHAQVYSGALYTVLTFRRDWSVVPAQSDTYEMHPHEISDAHIRYFVLLTAQSLFQHEGNLDQVGAIGRELAMEERAFVNHIQRREIQRPTLAVRDSYGNEDARDSFYRAYLDSY